MYLFRTFVRRIRRNGSQTRNDKNKRKDGQRRSQTPLISVTATVIPRTDYFACCFVYLYENHFVKNYLDCAYLFVVLYRYRSDVRG